LIPKIDNRVNIYVLQHLAETKNHKASAIIAKLYLQNYQCWQGEDFSDNLLLNTLLENYPENTVVVYPADHAQSLEYFASDYAENDVIEQESVNLILIDGTWRKASKIWHLSSNLHALPCIKLDPDYQSNYRIRKASKESYLSTIEAIVSCLSCLEKDEKKYQPLLNVFDKMIDFQINKMGDEVYQRNYSD